MSVRMRTIVPVVAMLSISAVLLAADNPFAGTWKVNFAKTKSTRQGPPPRSRTIKYDPYGADGIKSTMITVDAQGKSSHEEYAAKFDGKDYEITGDDPRQIVLKRIDTNTFEAAYKRRGANTSNARFVVSKDGKTLTIRTSGTAGNGERYSNDMRVYDKQ